MYYVYIYKLYSNIVIGIKIKSCVKRCILYIHTISFMLSCPFFFVFDRILGGACVTDLYVG
jgi:hypothetical protein